MDEHSIKKKRYLSRLFVMTTGQPKMMAVLIEIVKAYPIDVLDELFLKIETITNIEQVYITNCNQNNDEFVKYILTMTH